MQTVPVCGDMSIEIVYDADAPVGAIIRRAGEIVRASYLHNPESVLPENCREAVAVAGDLVPTDARLMPEHGVRIALYVRITEKRAHVHAHA